jgi:beta-barrel assembly-enhancing protease
LNAATHTSLPPGFLPAHGPTFKGRACAAVCALALVCTSLPSPALAQSVNPNQLPALGDSSAEDFSVGTERKLGDQIMREIRRDPDYLDDPLLLEYLQSLWQPLVAEARVLGNIGPDIDERFAWEPFLVRDRSVNAFALPGGYVGVHLGLMALTATRDELASVLAHEMSHVTQRHIARGIANSRKQSLIGIAALIVGLLAASRARSVDGANAAIVGSQAATAQGQLNFSRDAEREADRVGFATLAGAGFAPGGMAAMFEKLDQSSRLNDSGGFPYLRSHPLTTERIGEARSRLGTAAPVAPVSVVEHTLAQSRARVLMDPRVDALRRWQALDTDRTASTLADKLAAATGSALASSLLRDWSRADAALNNAQTLLRGADRPEPRAARFVQLLAVQTMLMRGDNQRAAALLQPFAGDGSRPAVLLNGRVALALAGNGTGPAAATLLNPRAEELQTWVTVHPSDAEAWVLLGQTWSRLNQPLRALRSEAESRLAVGDLGGAVDRLRAAQRLVRGGSGAGAGDFIEASVIDARLRDIESLRRQLMAEERAAR